MDSESSSPLQCLNKLADQNTKRESEKVTLFLEYLNHQLDNKSEDP